MKILQLVCLALLGFFLVADAPALFAQEGETETRLCRLTEDHDLRSGPGRNYKVMRKAEKGLLLEIIGEKVGYYRVRVPDGFQCYISADYLDVDSRHMGLVTGSRVNLRSIPRVEGDYPIFKVDRGDTLMVWDRVSDWYRVTAPEFAYGYVLKDSVAMVEKTAQALDEMESLKARREAAWLSHHNALVEAQEKAKFAKEMDELYKGLEASAAQGFKDADLQQTLADYEKVAANSPDDVARKLAAVRVNEVKALIAKAEAEDALKHKEDRLLREKAELKKSLVQVQQEKAAAEEKSNPGRIVTVLGKVEATDAGVLLRGSGTVYRLSCPDERYILADFDGRRLRIQGRSGGIQTKDTAPLVFVEHIEILK